MRKNNKDGNILADIYILWKKREFLKENYFRRDYFSSLSPFPNERYSIHASQACQALKINDKCLISEGLELFDRNRFGQVAGLIDIAFF